MVSLTKKEKKLSLFLFLPVYFIFGRFIISFLMMSALKMLNIHASIDVLNAWFNLVYDFSLTMIGVICFANYIKESMRKLSGHWLKLTIYSLTVGFVILYVANILSGLMITLISPTSSSTNQDLITHLTQLAPFPLIISSVILAPILEELVFRVAIFQNIYERNRLLAYLVSSLAFGCVHILSGLLAGDMSQLLFLFPYSLLGSVFCFLYEKKKTIYVPMVVHAANNLLSMVLIMFM